MEENSQNPSPQPLINPVLKSFLQIISVTGLYMIFTVLMYWLGMLVVENLMGVQIQDRVAKQNFADLDEGSIMGMKILQLIISAGSFIGTALFFIPYFAKEKSKAFFGFTKVIPPAKMFLWVLVIAVAAIPVLEYIASLVRLMPLPEGVENGAIQAQEASNILQAAFLQAPNIGILLLNIFAIAIIPAIGEELLFRGVYMQLLYRFFKQRIHIAVFISAFLFSIMHGQYYNFFSILLMGLLFGYLYYWSGNIMVTIWAHFINNGVAVVLSYLHQHNPDIAFLADDYTFPLPVILGCIAVAGIGIWQFYKTTQQYHPTIVEEDEE